MSEHAGLYESDEFAVTKIEIINACEKMAMCILAIVGGCIVFSPTKVNLLANVSMI